MLNQLFKYPRVLNRYLTSPLLDLRLDYLRHCAEQGFAQISLQLIAYYQLIITDYLSLQTARTITPSEIEAAADRWAQHPVLYRRANVTFSLSARDRFIKNATNWLQFLGRLQEPPSKPRPFEKMMAEFADFMLHEKGLSEMTIAFRCREVERFLSRVLGSDQALTQLTITRIDEIFLRSINQGDYARRSVQSIASALRAFFRYAANRGWCQSDLAEAIKAPRVFQHETLPCSPTWEEVQRLIDSAGGQRPADLRDRAILLLLAHYGLRAGEVCALQLDDLDWEKEIIHLRRNKTGRPQQFPLTQTAGEAILCYLREVRPRVVRREIFLTLRAPLRPLTSETIYRFMTYRWKLLGIAHHGPHSLRHACATRLINQGVSLKEIGDQLGHRNLDTTRIYAKVDLTGLRTVADFNLGGLL
jgi:site-specific recombinase XerD